MSWRVDILRAVFIGFIAFYSLLCLIMWGLQRNLMYQYSSVIDKPAAYGLSGFEEARVTSADGVRVQLWRKAPKLGYPTIVFFHGNAGNMAMRTPYFEAFAAAGFGVVGLDYRGFGKSEGTPTEEGLYADARAAVYYAMNELQLPVSELIFFGESLGTGVAVQMATEYDGAALVLVSPYTSMDVLAAARYPFLPVRYLLEDKYDSLQKITRVKEPSLILHGDNDWIVPVEHGRELFAKANEPKQAVYYPGKGHTDLDMGQLIKDMTAFCVAHNIVVVQAGEKQ